MKKKSMATNAIYSILYRTLNIIFPMLTTPYIARILNIIDIGNITYSQNIVNYFIMVANLGLPVYGIRTIAQVRHTYDKRNRVFSELFCINFISTLGAAFFYVIYMIIRNQLGLNNKYFIIMSLMVLSNFLNIDWLYQGIEEYRFITIRGIVLRGIVLCSLFLFVHTSTDKYIYTLILCIPMVVGNIINIVYSRSYITFNLNNVNLVRHIRPIIYLFTNTISYELYSKVDITLLGILCDSSIVGYYSYAQRIINLAVIGITSVTVVFLPRLSEYAQTNINKFNYLVSKGFRLLFLIAIPAFIGIILVSKDLVLILFGYKFNDSVILVQLLSPLIIIKAFQDFGYQILIATNNEKKIINGYIGALVINLVLDLFLIPCFGAKGAIFATLLGECFVTSYIIYLGRKYIKIVNLKPMIKSLFFSNTLMILGIICLNFLISIMWIRLILDVVIGVFIYVVVNYILGNDIVQEICNQIILKIKEKKGTTL